MQIMLGVPRSAPNTVFDMSQQSSAMRAGPSVYSLEKQKTEPVDTNPSDVQPPGVDEEIDYNTLEEALTS